MYGIVLSMKSTGGLEYGRRRARGFDSTDIRKRLPLVSRLLLDVYWDFYFAWIVQTRPRIVSAQTNVGNRCIRDLEGLIMAYRSHPAEKLP